MLYRTLAVTLALTTVVSAQTSPAASTKTTAPTTAPTTEPAAAPATVPTTALASNKGFVLEDGTPVRLRINRTVSSADAQVGETVDFEVLEEVLVGKTLVVPKGGLAFATVTEAQSKRRMARGGKLDINIDNVRLADGEKAALRAVKEVKGGGHTGAMTGGIVATSIVFFPAAPFFLFMHGKDITIPKGTEITAYISGDMKLDVAKFQASAAPAASPAEPSPKLEAAAFKAEESGSVQVTSTPDGADVYSDGAFVGNAPSTLKLAPGKHTVRVSSKGFKDWSREITVQSGSEVKLNAGLEKE